jgi:hypothetical protein
MCGYLWEDPTELVESLSAEGNENKHRLRGRRHHRSGVPEWFPWLAITMLIAALAVLALVYQNLQ